MASLYLTGSTHWIKSREVGLALAKDQAPAVLRHERDDTYSVYALSTEPRHKTQVSWQGPTSKADQARDQLIIKEN